MDPLTFFSKMSVPVGVLTSIIGGSAWLTSTHNRVEQVAREVSELKSEYRNEKDRLADRLQNQEEKLSQVVAKLSGVDAKLDLVINAIRKTK